MCDSVNTEELYKQFKKLKTQLEYSNSLIETLKIKNAKLQMESTVQNEKFNKTIKSLNDEIIELKSNSQIEKYRNLIHYLEDNRKSVYGKNNNLPGQLENEFIIIENLQSLLTDVFDTLYESSLSGISCDISFEVQIILDKLSKSRNRISMYIKPDKYILFLNKHRNELESILELLSSRCSSLKAKFELNSYDKWILREKDYLYSCEKHSENYQRLLYMHTLSDNASEGLNIAPFQLPDNFTEIHYTLDMKSILKNVLITSRNINNICFVEKDCFLVLDYIGENSSSGSKNTLYWTYDCYLLNTVRNLSKKMSPFFISEFRTFYKDCFGHNNYIHNFDKVLCDRGIKRWKQYKFLHENIRILHDEYMFGEIVRTVIRENCVYQPISVKDNIKGCAIGSVIKEYTEAQECFNKGNPYIDEQEYFTEVFDDLREFNDKEFNEQYIQRWKEFLKVYYK